MPEKMIIGPIFWTMSELCKLWFIAWGNLLLNEKFRSVEMSIMLDKQTI